MFRDTFYRTCVVLATVAGAYLIYRLSDLILVIFVAIIFASTVRPILETLTNYRIPRSIAIALIYAVSIAAFIGLIVVAIPPLVGLAIDLAQGDRLLGQLNKRIMELGVFVQKQIPVYFPVSLLPIQMREMLDVAEETVREQAMPAMQTTGYVIGQVVLAIVISVYWLVARRRALSMLLRASPRRFRDTVNHIWLDTEKTLGSYVRGQIVLALIVGTAVYVGLLLFRVPNALALAILAGLFEFIPFVGPIMAAIPAVILALAQSPIIAILVVVWYALIQQVEGNYLIPKIMGESLGLHPLIVLVSFFAGFQLNGIVGALLAIPVAGILQVTIQHLRRLSNDEDGSSKPDTTAESTQGLKPSP